MSLYFREGYSPIVENDLYDGLLKTLAKNITGALVPSLSLHYPLTADLVTNLFVIKKTLSDGGTPEVTRDVYIEFYRPLYVENVSDDGSTLSASTKENYYYFEVVYGTGIYTHPTTPNIDGNFTHAGTWEIDKSSVRTRMSWFNADSSAYIKGWVPVQYWISVDEDKISFILAGEPSASFEDRLISFGYIGSSKPFAGHADHPLGNFGVNMSSDKSPSEYLTTTEQAKYGERTGTGVTDICFLETYTGFPLQAHYPAFTTPDEFIPKNLEGPSAYTKRYHMSPIYIFHGFDGYRGELNGVVATDRSVVVNQDELIHLDTVNDNKDFYKVFLVNAPFSIFNNSTNILYGVAILKDRVHPIPVV